MQYKLLVKIVYIKNFTSNYDDSNIIKERQDRSINPSTSSGRTDWSLQEQSKWNKKR